MSMTAPPRPRTIRQDLPTWTEIAEGTGLAVATISRIFNGNRAPTLDSARRIAHFLGMSLDEFDQVLEDVLTGRAA